MTPDTPFTNDYLQRHSKLAALTCQIVGIAIPALLLVSWGLGDAANASVSQLGLPTDHTLSATQLILGTLLSVLPALALARALFGVATCFSHFARGDLFNAGQPRALNLAGRWLIVSGVLALVVPTVLTLVLSLNAGAGARVFAITVTGNGILVILFGALLWSLGHVWAVANRLAAENARFV